MSQRPRRFTSSRSMSPQKRRQASGEDSGESRSSTNMGKNWYFQQTPGSQVYYLKVVVGIVLGFIGILYNNHFVAGNWFIFPTIAVAGIYFFARNYLKIDKETIKDPALILWHGTISLYIGFIVSSALIWMILFPTHFVP